MVVIFDSGALRKRCNSHSSMVRAWGERRAKVLERRLSDLRAASTLEVLRNAPGALHVYKHRKDHTLTLNLDGGWRLYFQPADDPVPLLADGATLDWSRVTAVTIVGISDHDL